MPSSADTCRGFLGTTDPMPPKRVRIVLCTSGGICGAAVLDRLLASERIEVVGLVESSRILRRNYSSIRGALQQIRLSGFRYALYLWCCTSGADAAGYFFPRLRSAAMQAHRQRLPRLRTRDLNDTAGHAFLKALKPDLLVSAFFNQRIGRSACALCRAGGVNIHPSLLPEFKGVDPVFFSKLRQTAKHGVSVHRLNADFDCGDILFQERLALPAGESVLAITAALYCRGAGLLARRVDDIVSGVPGIPQTSTGCYDTWPTPSQVRALRRSGAALLRLRDFTGISWRI